MAPFVVLSRFIGWLNWNEGSGRDYFGYLFLFTRERSLKNLHGILWCEVLLTSKKGELQQEALMKILVAVLNSGRNNRFQIGTGSRKFGTDWDSGRDWNLAKGSVYGFWASRIRGGISGRGGIRDWSRVNKSGRYSGPNPFFSGWVESVWKIQNSGPEFATNWLRANFQNVEWGFALWGNGRIL